jgi:hypothetical protein
MQSGRLLILWHTLYTLTDVFSLNLVWTLDWGQWYRSSRFHAMKNTKDWTNLLRRSNPGAIQRRVFKFNTAKYHRNAVNIHSSALNRRCSHKSIGLYCSRWAQVTKALESYFYFPTSFQAVLLKHTCDFNFTAYWLHLPSQCFSSFV